MRAVVIQREEAVFDVGLDRSDRGAGVGLKDRELPGLDQRGATTVAFEIEAVNQGDRARKVVKTAEN